MCDEKLRKTSLSTLIILLLLCLSISLISPCEAKASSGIHYINHLPYTITEPGTYVLNTDGYIAGNINAITIKANNVILDGNNHTIKGIGKGLGVDVENVNNVTIKNMRITGLGCGIYLNDTSNNTIYNNSISNSMKGIEAIELDYSSYNIIYNNSISGVWGILLFHSSHNIIYNNNMSTEKRTLVARCVYLYHSSHNTIYNNRLSGIISIGIISLERSSHNNIIHNNSISMSYGGGIYLDHSSHNNIIHNNSISILKRPGCGMCLFSSGNVVRGNSFFFCGLYAGSYNNTVVDNFVNGKPLVYLEGMSNCVVKNAGQVILIGCNNITVSNLNLSNTNIGIELWNTNNSRITGNIIANNGYGIYLDHSSHNKFYHNNFINNSASPSLNYSKQVYSYNSVNTWDDGYSSGGNYWSDYNGVDSNGDGIGDTPYVIDENNVDHYPLMKPFSISVAPTISKSAEITISVPNTITFGSSVTITGSLSVAKSTSITLVYTKPDGSTVTRYVTSRSDGSFSDSYTPDIAGSWGVQASWSGDKNYKGVVSEKKTFIVRTSPYETLADLWEYKARLVGQFVLFFKRPDIVAQWQLDDMYRTGKKLGEEGLKAGLSGDVIDQFKYLLEVSKNVFETFSSSRAMWEIAIRNSQNDQNLKDVIINLNKVQSICQKIAQAYRDHNEQDALRYRQQLDDQILQSSAALNTFLNSVVGKTIPVKPTSIHSLQPIKKGETIYVPITNGEPNEIKKFSLSIRQNPKPEIRWWIFWNPGYPDYQASVQLFSSNLNPSFEMRGTDYGAEGSADTGVYAARLGSSDRIVITAKSLGAKSWSWFSYTPIESANIDITVTIEYRSITIDQQLVQSFFRPFINNMKETLSHFRFNS